MKIPLLSINYDISWCIYLYFIFYIIIVIYSYFLLYIHYSYLSIPNEISRRCLVFTPLDI